MIIETIKSYIAGTVSFEVLQDELADIILGDVEVGPDEYETARIADIRVAEFTGGYISERALKQSLWGETTRPQTSTIVIGGFHEATQTARSDTRVHLQTAAYS